MRRHALPAIAMSLLLASCGGDRQAAVQGEATSAQGLPMTSIPLLEPRPGLYAAGQPAPQDWAAIHARGVVTVINLRPDAETPGRDLAHEVRAAGMDYQQIEVAGPSDLNAANARRLQQAIDAAPGPVLVHCASANRVGGLLALAALQQPGVTAERALELGRRSGMRSAEAAVRLAIAQDCDNARQLC
ncbi:beta-lactamase hydrolase domain-containing protein [Luteimonas sp. e5]